MIRFQIAELVFSGGQTIPLEANSLVLLVGPNNSGKSTALSDVERLLGDPNQSGRIVVTSIRLEKDGDASQFRQWIKANYPHTTRNLKKAYITKGNIVLDSGIETSWPNDIPSIFQFLSHRLNTDERLHVVKPKERIDRNANPVEYIQVLQVDVDVLKKVSAEVKDAFQKDVIINWGGGRHVWFHVGDEPARNADDDRVSATYLNELEKLPRLENEGDGIKSFVGCVLGVLCGAHKVLLVDEPEAFLHPPQARKLGRLLADTAHKRERQVVAATHSPDVVNGALASNKPISVCRIERDGDQNHAYLLDSKQLSELWSKPLLRSTGAINGVFHKGVIVCEADADCRFFEALLDRLENARQLSEAPDLYFIHGGGKGAIDALVRAYRALNIKTVAVADFDLLRVKSNFEGVLASFGTELGALDGQYNSAVSALNDLQPISSAAQFVDEATKLIELVNKSHEVDSEVRGQFGALLSQSAKWSDAKKYGIRKLSGGAHTACKNVLEHCETHGLFIVREGELESFWREGPASKSDWIVAAIERMNSHPDSFQEADAFIKRACAFFGYA